MKKNRILIFLLIALLIGSNYVWFRLFKKEQEKLTHAIIPTLTEDYFLRQVALTKNMENYPVEREDTSKEEIYFKTEVPLIQQNPDYPNGCEAASAVMLLNIDISLTDFIEKYLRQEKVYEKDGNRYGPNPSLYYAGDPRDSKRGWGCFEPVILNAIQNVLADYQKENTDIFFHQNIKLSLSEQTDNEIPMMIWTTINYQEVEEVYEWFSFDNKKTYTYPKNAHAVVVTGKDDLYYYINDLLKKEKEIPILKEKLERSFDSMGRQLIALEFYSYSEEN